MVKKELAKLNKKALIRNLVELKGWKKYTIDTVFSRGAISKQLAPDLEEMTSISALFWMRPDLYNKKGDRI